MEERSGAHERRNSVRLDASCPCTYTRFDNQGKPFIQRRSRSINLSLDGVRLQSSYPVDLGEMLRITMALGDNLVTFRGEVVYVTYSEEQGFDFGLSIKDIGKMDKIALTRYIYYFKPSKETS